jgi:hypothetical protein
VSDQPLLEQAEPDARSTPAAAHAELEPTDARRLRSFASFFKNYMSVSAFLAAAAPIPVALFDLIPQYESQQNLTTTMSSLLAFLALAYIFFNRSALGRAWFGDFLLQQSSPSARTSLRSRRPLTSALPLLLIVLSLASLFAYLFMLEQSADVAGQSIAAELREAEFGEIRQAPLLMGLLIMFFVLAEAAFIVMALREYTQDLLGITDRELISTFLNGSQHDDPIVRNAARMVSAGEASIEPSGSTYFVKVRDRRTNYEYSLPREEFEVALAREQELSQFGA